MKTQDDSIDENKIDLVGSMESTTDPYLFFKFLSAAFLWIGGFLALVPFLGLIMRLFLGSGDFLTPFVFVSLILSGIFMLWLGFVGQLIYDIFNLISKPTK